MGADDLEKKIQKNIKSNLTHKDLLNLCSFLNIQLSGRKTYIQDRLLDHIKTLNYNSLYMMSAKIDEYMKASTSKPRQILSQKPAETGRYESSTFPMTSEKLTDNILKNSPVNLESEIPIYCRNELVIQPSLPYHSQVTNVPVNERDVQLRIQNTLPTVQLSKSPFYCSSVCIHPLSLLIPSHYPNVVQNNRNMNKVHFNFVLTENIKQIITKNQYTVNNKTDYKWQILLRFTAIDPNNTSFNFDEKIPECIPPYLQVSVNGVNQPLWEILPSNCRMKEGKRHAKPVHISDKLTDKTRTSHGSRQLIEISWWQTPAVYMYYYMGIYLERKLTVKEMMVPYVSNHMNNRPIEETLKMIQNKLGDVSKNKRKDIDDDDLVISNVLPINLCCPVGKSRIEIPLRTISCQHLQCFDAHLFLSMNERRPVWKCPVCDNRASPSDLFCDKFFEKILNHFKDDDEVTDVNVHPDNSFVAVRRNKDRGDPADKFDKSPNVESSAPSQAKIVLDQDLIVLDSDDEIETVAPPVTQKEKSTGPEKSSKSNEDIDFRRHVTNKSTTNTVQINVCNEDSNIGEIERIINTQDGSGTARIPSTAAQQSDRLPAITNVLSTFDINGSSHSPFATRQETTTNNLPTSTVTNSNSTTSSMATAQSTITTVPTSSLPPPMYPASRLDSPLSPPIFHSTVINSVPPLPTPSLFSQSAQKGSQNTTSSSPVVVPPTITTGKPVSTIITNRHNPKTPVYTPKHTTTSYADIIRTESLQSSQIAEPARSKETPISKPSPSVICTPTIPVSLPSYTLPSNRNSSAKSIFDVNNYKRTKVAAPVTNVLKPPNNDVESSRDAEIVRTLNVNVSPIVVRNRTGNQSPEPIVCPNVIFSESDVSKEQPKPIADETPNKAPSVPPVANKKSDQQPAKKSKMTMSKIPPPPSPVVIPSVTIDLTEEDDDTPQPTPIVNNQKSKNPFMPKPINNNVKWVSVTAPISNALKTNPNGLNSLPSNNNINRFSYTEKNKEGNYKRTLDPAVNHYKPHQMKHSSNNNIKSQPIDLTGDDEDEDHSPPKRFRPNCNFKEKRDPEDGQVDTESCSSDESLLQNSNNMRHVSKKNVAASHM